MKITLAEPERIPKRINYNAPTLALFKAMGFEVGKVEFYNSHSKQSKDLFGIFDYIAISDSLAADKVVGVQSTGLNGWSSHLKTLRDSKQLPRWVAAGNYAVLVAWHQQKVKSRVFWDAKVMYWDNQLITGVQTTREGLITYLNDLIVS
jgi:hypothetical protein